MEAKTLRVVSLFSGIGGFEEGIKNSKLNAKIIFASDIDKYAQISYDANFNSENLVGDIKQINEKDIPDHDLLCGGFPCQSFSIAGKQKGFEDIRGTLFFDIVRILKEKKPKYILLENVKNLVSHDNSSTIKTILSTLNDIGYTIDFTIINSYESGVPQNRDRTYIFGIYNHKTEKYQKDKRNPKINSLKTELNNKNFHSFNFFNNVIFKNKKRCIADVLEDEVLPSFFIDTDKTRNFLKSININENNNKADRIIKLFDLPRNVHNDLERQRRVYSIYGISPTALARSDTTKILVETNQGKKIRKITPSENFYIQGFSKKFVDNIKKAGMSMTQMYKQSGNAVSPPVIAEIMNEIEDEFIKND